MELVLLAASMPHHVAQVGELVATLRRDLTTRHVRVLVGGHSCGPADLWQSTGAWAANAAEAVAVTREMFE